MNEKGSKLGRSLASRWCRTARAHRKAVTAYTTRLQVMFASAIFFVRWYICEHGKRKTLRMNHMKLLEGAGFGGRKVHLNCPFASAHQWRCVKFPASTPRWSGSSATERVWCIISLSLYTFSHLWSPYGIGQTIIFMLFLSFFLLFLFPRLISAVGDWMSTILPHMVWP